jgi:hypothetical protein
MAVFSGGDHRSTDLAPGERVEPVGCVLVLGETDTSRACREQAGDEFDSPETRERELQLR